MSFEDVFGGSTVQPSDVSFSSVALSESILTYWPPFDTTGQVLSRIMKVSASLPALTISLPDATLVSGGQDVLFDNSGAESFSVLDYDGNIVATVDAGAVKYLYLSSTATQAGVWRTVLFGASAAEVDAAALVGYGIKAIGTTLNQASVTSTISANKIFSSSDRAQTFVNTGGSITGTLPLTNTLSDDFFFEIRNQGTGTITLAPSGGEFIDGSASIILVVNESCIVHCASGAWYTVGRGRNTLFNFTQLTKTVTGGTTTLTLTEASNVVQTYSGTLLSNQIVVLPAVVQVYYVANNTTGAFTFTFQSPTPGSTVVLAQGQTAVLFCNGVNVVNASTSTTGILSILLAAGSVGSPSLAFSAANNGFFAPSSTTLAVAPNGVEAGRWSGTQYQAPTGSAGAPSFSFVSSTGTGIYNPSANALGFSINAALAMLLDSSGNLGIGMTPTKKLDVTGNAGISGTLTVGTLAGVGGTLTYTGIQDFTGATTLVATAAPGTSTTAAASTAFVAISFAPLASPTFTGVPAAPTAEPGTNTTQIATTAFVAVSYAPLASPTFTGVPAAPTAATGTSTTQLATTAFVANTFAAPPALGSGTPAAVSGTTINSTGNIGAGLVPTARNNTSLQTLDGLGFPSTAVASTDPNTLDIYLEASYTGTATGMTTSPTGTINFVRNGKTVTMSISSGLFTGTSNATTFTITGGPTTMRPTSTKSCLGRGVDNGAGLTTAVNIQIETTGLITLFSNPAGGAWTNSGAKALSNSSFTYDLS